MIRFQVEPAAKRKAIEHTEKELHVDEEMRVFKINPTLLFAFSSLPEG